MVQLSPFRGSRGTMARISGGKNKWLIIIIIICAVAAVAVHKMTSQASSSLEQKQRLERAHSHHRSPDYTAPRPDHSTCWSNRAALLLMDPDSIEADGDGCGQHGSCLVDRCICDPTHTGIHCDMPQRVKDPSCTSSSTSSYNAQKLDRCMNTVEGYGRLRQASKRRAGAAFQCETGFWERLGRCRRNWGGTLYQNTFDLRNWYGTSNDSVGDID
jgi:hypothetical protein